MKDRGSTYYSSYLSSVNGALINLVVSDNKGNELTKEEGLVAWCRICHETRMNNKTMYFIGNGASATMASHMAADFSKNCNCRATAFNDVALMTAVSNDIKYDECFSVPLERFAESRDLLVTISSSGNSSNILNALSKAKELDLYTITLSGMSPQNKSREEGDFNFWIPADTYGIVEASHQVLLHCWLDTYLEIYSS
jgi:D-sedoheptulose 7-phosphate isomerase